MSEKTEIAWADSTFNPWIGCTKIGPGCDNCYAKADFEDRKHRVVWGAGQPRSRTKTWGDPVRWNKQADAFFVECGRRQRVFCASLADVFDNEVDTQWRDDLFELILSTPNLDWLLLTKRIGNVYSMVPLKWLGSPLRGRNGTVVHDAGWPEHVWIGATITSQAEADRDLPKLERVPAARRFVSIEPMLGAIDLGLMQYHDSDHTDDQGRIIANTRRRWLRWVICGGESGPNARAMHPDWARSLRDQCAIADVPFLFKQWGEWSSGENVTAKTGTVQTATWFNGAWSMGSECLADTNGHSDDEPDLYRIGKKAAGRLLDGRTWDEVPS